jgi:hypothetical protein
MTVARSADELILERAERDLDEGLAHTKERIRATVHNPFLRVPFEAAVFGAVHTLQLKHRYRDDVKFLLSLAHKVAAGEDPRALAEANVDRALRTKELALIVREKDPAFKTILERNVDLMATRLPDLARMATVKDPVDYPDIVRRAFPDRKEVESLIASNRLFTLWLIEHFEAHPHLLRVPHSFLPKLSELSREMVEWQTARVLRALDAIY